jgi:hypothetical protein
MQRTRMQKKEARRPESAGGASETMGSSGDDFTYPTGHTWDNARPTREPCGCSRAISLPGTQWQGEGKARAHATHLVRIKGTAR